ncbi:MAG TPA: hypothetical protein VFB25_03750 [Gaiellaceae bacterium]|nr:hypothetical protein [Gaiellaceae bacterium]
MDLLARIDWVRLSVWLPALVIGTGLVAGTLILLGRAFAQTWREAGHPRLLWGGVIIVVGAVVVLTWLGVQLPRE